MTYDQHQALMDQNGQKVYVVQAGAPQGPPLAGRNVRIVDRPGFKDGWAAVLFLIFLAGFVAMAVIGVPNVINEIKGGNGINISSGDFQLDVKQVAQIIGYAALTGLGMSVVWFLLMIKFAGTMIHISYILSALLVIASGAYFVYTRNYVAGVIWIFFGLLFLLSYCGTIVAAFLGLIITAIFDVAWIATVIGGYQWAVNNNLSTAIKIVIGLLLLFFLYWCSEVIRNVVHVTVSGTFATYYFTAIQQPGREIGTVPSSAVTAKSAGRALTTSFGSICFGSLLIAILDTLRSLARSAENNAANNGDILQCLCFACITCILYCIEDILLYFNKYAFTQVAIYGKSYCDAGRDTWELFKRAGFTAIINDSLIGSVLGVGSLCVGLVCALVGFLLVKFSTTITQNTTTYVIVCVVSALIGMWLFLILTEVINSGVAS
ncbi:putative choline transporter, neither null mutation nor overexpression affects choline transport [Cladochytrium tenue]|nr:putative choline transporter, neither null mutation nor overexpression affects choline transport [Cladochytrium tenue]